MNEDRVRKSSHKAGSRSPPKSKPQSAEKKSRADSNKRLSSKSPKRKSMQSHESMISIRTLPGGEVMKSNAEYEDLSNQGLTTINPKLFQKTTLRKLILTGNNLRSLPAAISDLINLEFIDLSKNPLRVKDVDDSNCLPLEMRLLKNLKYMSLRECNLRAIPTTVWLCRSLQRLDLSRNKLGLLVPDIGNLNNLVWLNLVQCNLSTLPSELSFCAELVEIDLMSNHIESLPETLRDLRFLETLRMSFSAFTALLDSYMEQLISKNQIKSEHIPVVVFELESLLELDLKRTKINNLPENNFQKLKRLYLDHNYFEDLLDSNLRATQHTLTELTVSHNILKRIPDEIYYLRALTLLDLSHNQIGSLSSRPLDMPELKQLHLSGNKLARLDSSLEMLANLEELTLDHNELVHVDDSVYGLSNLRYLDLSYNKLTSISPKLAALTRLASAHLYDKFNKRGLWVIGNPLETPPKEIWQTTHVNKIANYLSCYHQRNLEFVYYAQLIFVATQPRLLRLSDSIFAQKFHPGADYDAGNNKNNNNNNTKVVRRFYKRTENKCEFSVLDIADVDAVGSLFLAHVEFEHEPVIVCLLFDAAAYSSQSHANELGKLIQAVLVRTRSHVRIRLVGLGKLVDINEQTVLENARSTINEYFSHLENETSAKSGLADELLAKRQVYLGETVFCVETLDRDHLNQFLGYLETEVIALNWTAKLAKRAQLRARLNKLVLNTTNRIELDEVLESLEHNMEDFTYAKTLNELLWLRFDRKQSHLVYFHFDYMLNLINKFMRLDLKPNLSKIGHFEKSIDSFDSKPDVLKSVSLFKKYGQCEHKLLKYIYYELDEAEMGRSQAPMNDSLDLLERFGLLFKSLNQHAADEKVRSYFQTVFPLACSISYQEVAHRRLNNQKNNSTSSLSSLSSSQWDDCLYSPHTFELYFIRLDQIQRYQDECKELNALRKEKNMWASHTGPADNEFYNYYECDLSAGYNKLADEDLDMRQIEHSIFDADGNLSFRDEAGCLAEFANADSRAKLAVFSSSSEVQMPRCFFARFLVAMQPMLAQRFDWIDALVARNLDGTCVRVMFNNRDAAATDSTAFAADASLTVEIKAKSARLMEQMKQNVIDVVDEIKVYYPGLDCFIKVVD